MISVSIYLRVYKFGVEDVVSNPSFWCRDIAETSLYLYELHAPEQTNHMCR